MSQLGQLPENARGEEQAPKESNELFAKSPSAGSEFQVESVAVPESSLQEEVTLKDQPIKLQVGERHFETTASTLRESNYFKALLSDEWRHSARPDGSFYVDGDGGLFEHILRYLRRLVLPIFYDKLNGHNELLYTALLQESKFYGIDRLRQWLEKRKYLEAVQVTVSTTFSEYDFGNGKPNSEHTQLGSGADVSYDAVWYKRRTYLCPRGIPVHKGNRAACGRQCMNARGDQDEFEEVPVLRVVNIAKTTMIDSELCLGGWDE